MRKQFCRKISAALMALCLTVGMCGCGGSADTVVDTEEYEEWSETDYESYSEVEPETADWEVSEMAEEEYGNSDLDYYAEEIGVTFHMPEEYGDTKGIVDFYSRDVTDGEGIFIAQMVYFGLTWDEYDKMFQSDSISDEDAENVAKKIVPIFIVMAAPKEKDGGEIIENINAMTESNYSADMLTPLREVDGFCFYQYTPALPENYENLDQEFREEYDKLAAFNNDVLEKADYTRPQTKYEKMMGNQISFTTTDFDGNTVTSEEIFGQHEITMVNVWATWCGWCIGELAELEKINNNLASIDCGIVGFCGDANSPETLAEAKSLLNDNGVTYLNICPFDGWEEIFDMTGWPTSFFVDRNGKIVTTPISGAKVGEYEQHIRDALNGNTTNVVKETNSYGNNGDAYRIIVADDTSRPVEGAMVQFCTADTCKIAPTDSTGTAVFNDPPGVYDVHILKVPDGYKKNDNEYRTEEYYSDMVITVERD